MFLSKASFREALLFCHMMVPAQATNGRPYGVDRQCMCVRRDTRPRVSKISEGNSMDGGACTNPSVKIRDFASSLFKKGAFYFDRREATPQLSATA